MSRYDAAPSEGEILPNKLGLADIEAINKEELIGFAQAEHDAVDALQPDTVFTLDYLYDLHRAALGSLYDFAGKLRTVNMSKDGFAFPAAEFLPTNLQEFERKFLRPFSGDNKWEEDEEDMDFMKRLAALHAELLYIHPFREGNGRIVRLFTRLIALAKSGKDLNFELLTRGDNFQRYVAAVQQAAKGEYGLMQELFSEMQA